MRTWRYLLIGTLPGAGLLLLIIVLDPDSRVLLVLSDGLQLLAATAAAVGCAIAGQRAAGRRRSSWRWVGAGAGAWAAGQAVWTYYEVALAQEAPFPSPADAGFLLFPLLAGFGLVRWLGTQQHQLVARGRDLLDGAAIAGSLLVVSWVTTLDSVFASGSGLGWSLVLSLAYPVGDLVLATLVLLALTRSGPAERATLGGLAVGLGGLAAADSIYVYLTGTSAYTSANLVSSGWVFGFAWVAATALAARSDHTALPDQHRAQRSLLQVLLPYFSLVIAVIALGVSLGRSESTPTTELLMALALVLVVIARQLLELLDNQRLLGELAHARDELESRTLHDPLTGLANRVLLADRLDQALLRPAASVSALFCDLDDFKDVNDRYGHDVGDALLVETAARMQTCVRAGDTVARIGGDEFAVLLIDSVDAAGVAERLVAAMTQPVLVRGHEVRTSMSVGLAHRVTVREDRAAERRAAGVTVGSGTAVDDPASAAALLQRADQAMYAAKWAGKSQVAFSEDAEAAQPVR